MENGKLVIFSAPSGSGKTTIVRHLLKAFSDKLAFSISATSRPKRGIEEIITAVFEKEKGGPCVNAKADDKEITAYFAIVLPEYDKERVYVSNMRKLFNWYTILQTTGNLKEKDANSETEESKAVKAAEKHASAKTKTKDTGKNIKTSAGNKVTTGVRKTGTA